MMRTFNNRVMGAAHEHHPTCQFGLRPVLDEESGIRRAIRQSYSREQDRAKNRGRFGPKIEGNRVIDDNRRSPQPFGGGEVRL